MGTILISRFTKVWFSLWLSSPTVAACQHDLVLMVTSLVDTGSLLDDVEIGIADTSSQSLTLIGMSCWMLLVNWLWFVLIICNLDHCSPNFPITSSLDNCQSPKKPLGEIVFEDYNISNLLFLALWMTVSWHDDTLWGLLGTFFSRVIGIDSVCVLLTFLDQWIMNTGHFRKLHS